MMRLLVFRVGALDCAAEAGAVREILPRLAVTRIPGAPAVVGGLINVRGTLVTLVQGWRALGQAQPEAGGGATTLLLEVGEDRQPIGFTADEVLDLITIAERDLDARKALPGLDPTMVRAVGRRGGRIFVVLDTDALLAPILS